MCRARPDPKAAQFLRLGEYHWNRRTRDSLLKAVDAFRQAGEADPANAQAFAYLADCYAILPDYQDLVDPTLAEKGIAAARRALAIDPNLAMAHGALAVIYFSSQWNWKPRNRSSERRSRSTRIIRCPISATVRR